MEYPSKSDILTAELRSLIRSGGLPGGTVLRQREIADRFGVSPTPVREALRRLESEGHVTTELHRAATVVTVDQRRIYEDLLIMANLEPLAAALAAEKVTADDIDEICAIDEEIGALGQNDPAITELNRRFHFRIYECAGSPILLSLLSLLWRSATAQVPITRWDDMADEHALIIRALRDGSPSLAAEHTRNHIMSAAATKRPAMS